MAKPALDQLAIVTATTSLERSRPCRWSWEQHAAHKLHVYEVLNGGDTGKPYLGVVPAFAAGVRRALAAGHEIIACLHDDLMILEDDWDLLVLQHFRMHPESGLAGFLGGKGLGRDDIYRTPYSPYQLAREQVLSNEKNAEAHGQRWLIPTRVAVLDGFSQIGRRKFWEGRFRDGRLQRDQVYPGDPHAWGPHGGTNLYAEMASWGLTHHAYDAALGAFAARLGWHVWMLPIQCWHLGGQTAVGDPGYAEWAKTIVPEGDQDFWAIAHQLVYERFRDVLPVRV